VKKLTEPVYPGKIIIQLFYHFSFQVHWFEQQVEKKRVKRDFPYFEGPSGTGGPFYSTAHSFLPQPSSYNGFIDPLYKEQWYLV
jgi:hypothetical protein